MFSIFFSLILLLVTLYVYLRWNFNYWIERGIFGPKPMALLGNYPKSALLLRNIMYEQQTLYEGHKQNHRFIGVFERRTPKLLILDPILVSDIYVKYFKHFQVNDSSSSFDEVLDPIFSRNIFAAPYNEWRNRRPEISQAFTKVKLRQMVPIISISAEKMIQYIDMQMGNRKQQTTNAKDLSSRFTADIVMHCIYGLDSNAFQATAPMHKNLVHWFSPSLTKNIANAILSTFPFLSSIYKPSFFPFELTKWFYETMEIAIFHRQHTHDSNNRHNDFLQFLLERKSSKSYTNADLTNIAATFFFDAFETSSIMLAQALYHVANNERCQKRLRDEISMQLPFERRPTIDEIDAMPYLDNVVNETFRISPSAFLLAKNCTEPIKLTDYDGTELLVERGTSIQLPVYAIHHDERFYTEPDVFKPERFMDVNMNELKKTGQLLMFGDGPRICIGRKFAMFQIKIGLIEIIRHFSISVNAKMCEPVHASSLDSLLTPISDIYLDFQRFRTN